MKTWIGFDEPRSGWTSLALSCGGILALVLGFIVLGSGPLPDRFRSCTAPGCYFRGYSVLIVLVLAPCLSIAGWRIGNRRGDASDSGRHIISLVPDGRTLGKLGLAFMAAALLFAAGAYLLFAYALSKPPIL